MADQQKKISFGFSKLQKKNTFSKPVQSKNKVELIDCLESQTIKLKSPKDEKQIKGPIVIPLQPSKNLFGKKELNNKVTGESEANGEQKPDSELSIDELAARELIKDTQNKLAVAAQPGSIGINESAESGDKNESTLEDYDAVPITQFGMAMLRGMGWSEGTGIGKRKKSAKSNEPTLRPKGMGLGVNLPSSKKINTDSSDGNEELVLKTGGYGKVIEGNHKGNYFEIQGFDEEAGRIIVKTALGGTVLNLSEFLVKPVSKKEFESLSKVLNNEKYEKHKSNATNEQSRGRMSPHSHKSSRNHSRSPHRKH